MSAMLDLAVVLALLAISTSCENRREYGWGGEFALSQRDGHPIYVSGESCFNFDWSGRFLSVTPRNHDDECKTGMIDMYKTAPYWQYERLEELIDGEYEVIRTLLSDNLPTGWRQIAITSVATFNGDRRDSEKTGFHAYCCGGSEVELLAEFDLDEMFAMLYGADKAELSQAEVRSASFGPEGAIGLVVHFQLRDGSFFGECGIFDGGKWIPTPSSQVNNMAREIVMGPQNRAVVLRGPSGPHILDFRDSQGKSLNTVSAYPRNLDMLAATWRRQAMYRTCIACIASFAVVALLGLLWWFGPLKRIAKAA